jgi:predicted Zn-dependent protease
VIGALSLGGRAATMSPDAANALMAGGQAGAIQNPLNFSRDMEREADRIGYGVMTQAGFEPQGFVTMFDKLQQASRLNDSGNFPYLRTHPMHTERIADMQARQQLATRSTSSSDGDLVHSMMVGRARVLSNPGVDALRSYVTEAEAAPASAPRSRQATALYAAALASARLREPALAARFAGRLAALTAGDATAARLTGLLAAEIALQSGDPSRALALTEGASNARPELIFSAQAQIQNGSAAEAAQRLQTWVALHPRDAQAWQLLARAYAAQGQALR